MKKLLFSLLLGLFSQMSFAFDITKVDFEGQWVLVSKEHPAKFNLDLHFSSSQDPKGFRHSYYFNAIKSPLTGMGIFLLPSQRNGRFAQHLRFNKRDNQFHLFEVLGVQGSPSPLVIFLGQGDSKISFELRKR